MCEPIFCQMMSLKKIEIEEENFVIDVVQLDVSL